MVRISSFVLRFNEESYSVTGKTKNGVEFHEQDKIRKMY